MQEDKNRGMFEQQDALIPRKKKFGVRRRRKPDQGLDPDIYQTRNASMLVGRLLRGALKIAIYLLVELLIVKFP